MEMDEHEDVTRDERAWATMAHALALAGGILLPLGGNLAVPLVIWLTKRRESEFVAWHAKESFNFQASCMLYAFACVMLCLCLLVLVGYPSLLLLGVAWPVMAAYAAFRAWQGRRWEYPLTISFLR